MPEIKVPELAETISEGTIAKWLKQPGDYVSKGEYVVELETDKVNVEISSEHEGILAELIVGEGDTVQVGATIAIIHEGETLSTNTEETTDSVEPNDLKKPLVNSTNKNEDIQMKPYERIIASPAARKLAREKGIDLREIPTVDPLGRVRKQDVVQVERKARNQETYATTPVTNQTGQTTAVDEGKSVERIRMSRRRETIANRLVEVQQTAAMLTTFNEVDMSAVMELRKKWKDRFYEENDVRLGYMAFFTKAVVAALKKTPYLNAEIQGNELLIKKYYDIGVAVSTDEGLVVPVIRGADRKNFAELEGDLVELAEKARTNKLSLHELQGGTFTITNGGVFGSLLSTPILNGPQVGILGMHTIQLRPVALDKDRIENRPMMYIALSYDHRIVDGKAAVTFLKKVKELIEDPELLLFGS
ncbi:2-oxoglutarate dehydrogenase complex dihydrolipoyllysine-residue succinyltransferase [Bacillus sp. B15-48]|uniref:2-oxoglutarate dehydrogenase complex dihydrolipoyllysine-residue succinyltransferase n=1 Tax=Bacillus sp. B15-48 TaxID=1548601 RepID=UPI00193FBF7B|nr:2-oxoglutarate dehydrogenase complex dihydrolipoyllysine-residue succinyltransferase [Bacillus sp. B15-48]